MADAGVRAAASVVLVREAEPGLEVFLLRRAQTMAFAPGMHVFPGGRVDPEDHVAGRLLDGYPFAAELARANADEPTLRANVACALREVREESGVLLAPADLVLVDHWVTPEHSPLRYDVRFFIASLPTGQQATAQGTEMDDVAWLAPAEAVRRAEAGLLPMLLPTLRVLSFLAGFRTIDDANTASRDRALCPKLPRWNGRSWDLVDAYTDAVVERDVVQGPDIEGGAIR